MQWGTASSHGGRHWIHHGHNFIAAEVSTVSVVSAARHRVPARVPSLSESLCHTLLDS